MAVLSQSQESPSWDFVIQNYNCLDFATLTYSPCLLFPRCCLVKHQYSICSLYTCKTMRASMVSIMGRGAPIARRMLGNRMNPSRTSCRGLNRVIYEEHISKTPV